MAQRSTGSATISFGLVAIPVKLYLTASEDRVSFKMIAPKTKNRVNQKIVDSVTGEEVNRGECLSGYEYKKNSIVVFTDEELATMGAPADKKDSIEIDQFVPNELSPLRVEKSYFIGPQKGADKAYTLLRMLLNKSNKMAVGKWYARGKEHLVAITPHEDGLLVHQMYYNTEMRSFDNTCAKLQVTDAELAMGLQLVNHLSKPVFDVSEYHDGFVQSVAAAAETKINGGTLALDDKPATAPSTDLMAALQASLSKAS